MDAYMQEVVPSEGVCCTNTRTLDHFCGNGSLLQKKQARCNECGAEVMGEIWKSNDSPPRIYMRKYCSVCGITSSRISSDAQFYYVQKESQACGCGPQGCGATTLGENAKTVSRLHTCTLVVEIVYDCNLSCPTCYADSPHISSGRSKQYIAINDFKKQILSMILKQGKIDIVQLSGGEPTLHPHLCTLIAWLGEQKEVGHILLNTNGVGLLDIDFMETLQNIAPQGRFSIYLQYDGTTESGQYALRGGDFRIMRERVRNYCHRYAIPVALVMTVTHENKFECDTVLLSALDDDNVRWIVYQPEFISGRNIKTKKLENPINVADVIHAVARGEIMNINSWIPLPCSDPNCGMVGFLVRKNGVWYPASQLVDIQQFIPFIANRMNFDITDSVSSCGCDAYDLSTHLNQFGVSPQDIKMLFIKPFMDVRTWDQSRIDACCTHVLTPEGTVDSFCRYYSSK